MMRLWLLAFFLFLAAHGAAQDSVLVVPDSLADPGPPAWTHAASDTLLVKVRSIDSAKWSTLKKDDDYDYRQPPSVAESLLDRFLFFLAEFLSRLFQGATQTDWGRVLLYTLGLIVIIVVVMMIMKVDAFRVFYAGSDRGTVGPGVIEEDIHAMDFESLIATARANGDFRTAVRLLFLFSLKLLSDKQYLEWRPGKTNQDYLNELRSEGPKKEFNELSFYFDYSWYGEFTVNEPLFEKIQRVFEDLKRQVS